MTGPLGSDPNTPSGLAPGGSSSMFSRRRLLQSPNEALQPEEAPPPPPLPPSKRRPILSAISGFFSFLLILVVATFIGLGFANHRMNQPGTLTSDRVLVIAPRTELPDIISQLEREGVIDSPTLFGLALWLEGNRSNVKSGEYLFKQNASLQEVMDTLVSGKQILHSLTIPEGLTSEQIVQRLRDNDVLSGEIRDVPKEGTLLPDTYKFERGYSRTLLLRKMQEDQRQVLAQIWARRSPDLPLRSPSEVVTLASIVEKETGKADERPRVARVFLNRLSKRMKLQSDPTIVYGLVGGRGTLGRGITRSELQQATPYNTYVIEGLPPGPIANPGRAAIEAVINPARTNDLYFVADGTGGHAFADSLDQHNRNVVRWRQLEKDRLSAAPAEPDRAPLPDLPPTPGIGPRGDLGLDGVAPAGSTMPQMITLGSAAADPISVPGAGVAAVVPTAQPALATTVRGLPKPATAVTVAPVQQPEEAKSAAAPAPDQRQDAFAALGYAEVKGPFGGLDPFAAPAADAGATVALEKAKTPLEPSSPVSDPFGKVIALGLPSALPEQLPDVPAPVPVPAQRASSAPSSPAPVAEAQPKNRFQPGLSLNLGLDVKAPAPVGTALLDGPVDNPGGDPPDVSSNVLLPVSPKMQADIKAKQAKYGLSATSNQILPGSDLGDQQASIQPSAQQRQPMPPINGRVRVLDASEGTTLDPLLAKNWDLNSAQSVPVGIR